jgi:hypothetical protein
VRWAVAAVLVIATVGVAGYFGTGTSEPRGVRAFPSFIVCSGEAETFACTPATGPRGRRTYRFHLMLEPGGSLGWTGLTVFCGGPVLPLRCVKPAQGITPLPSGEVALYEPAG